MEQSWIERLFLMWNRLRTKAYTAIITPCFLSAGQRISITPPFRFFNLSLIRLGDGVTIHGNCWIQVVQTGTNTNIPTIILRDNVCLGMNSTISAAKEIHIGEHVFTARNVYISDHSHEFHDITVPTARQGIGKVAAVSIGAETWIGQNAIILPGVQIGRHCVIGANSVVNSDIPDFSVAAGAPARVLRTYDHVADRWEMVAECRKL